MPNADFGLSIARCYCSRGGKSQIQNRHSAFANRYAGFVQTSIVPLSLMRILFFILPFLLFACGEKKTAVPVPADLIPRDKMVEVMTDVHLLEAAMQISSVPGPEHKEFANYDIFKKYGYTHDQYERSIAWYSTRLEDFDKMYDEVLARISRKMAEEMGAKQIDPSKDKDTAAKPSGKKPRVMVMPAQEIPKK
ncbi:MAG: hypothetical protein FD123_2499 [Bacteroidetes bacterium]|nr:MAG: hypothetical protein FD123_2499 [Bacteroidota bacterium]